MLRQGQTSYYLLFTHFNSFVSLICKTIRVHCIGSIVTTSEAKNHFEIDRGLHLSSLWSLAMGEWCYVDRQTGCLCRRLRDGERGNNQKPCAMLHKKPSQKHKLLGVNGPPIRS